MENSWIVRDMMNKGWLHPEEAEAMQLHINRLRQQLYAATHCPECSRELPPRRCEHCNGDYSIDA